MELWKGWQQTLASTYLIHHAVFVRINFGDTIQFNSSNNVFPQYADVTSPVPSASPPHPIVESGV